MMKKRFNILLLIGLFGVLSCKKDKISNECRDLDMSQLINIVGGPYYTFVGERLRNPAFNPNNDNEIMFVKEGPDKQIYVYNLVSRNKELIYEGDLSGRPSWGKNDYIIFYKLGGHIWKIRGDGQDLTYLNNPMPVYHPQWNSQGTKFAANNSTYQAPDELVIFDENGTVLEAIPITIPGGHFKSPSSFGREDVLVLRRSYDITFYDLENHEILGKYQTQLGFGYQTGAGGNIFWLDSTKLIYGNRDGIHQITFPGLQNTHLVTGCTSRYYSTGSVNKSRTKMVWEVVEQSINENKTRINSKRYLVLMDVDGRNEQKIEIEF